MSLFRTSKTRWIFIGAFVAIWTLMALLATVESYVSPLAIGKPVSWGLALGRYLQDWHTCGVLSLGVLWDCRFKQVAPGRTGRLVGAHMAGDVGFFLSDVPISYLL